MQTEVAGLSTEQVAERVARGQTNDAPDPHSRSLASIIRANTLTWFNALIGSMWVVMWFVAPFQDSLFGFVIVANSLIGIVQEWRASRALAKLSVIGEVRPLVRRDGTDVEVRPAEVVLDDVVILRPGDQLVVDGDVIAADGLEIDESLLTGEADPVDKSIGDLAMSGSFVVAGSGMYVATRVGRDSFAAGLTEQAKKFTQTRSELRDDIAKFIRLASFLIPPVGIILLISQLRANQSVDDAIRGTIAGVVTMVPEGLVLLTSIAMAVAVVRLAQRKVLVQDLPAVEVLARVDTVCVDKTGTLTEPGMAVTDVEVLDGSVDVDSALAAMGASEESPNPTLQAVAQAYANPTWSMVEGIAFSSARKWSAATFRDHGTWLLGAPEVILGESDRAVADRAQVLASQGSRVLLLARSTGPAPDADAGPGASTPAALVVIDQRLRSDAAETVSYFLEQDVAIKVISGDNPATVGAIAEQAGVPHAAEPLDARELTEDPALLEEPIDSHSVFGRVTPAQKQAMVGALHLRGRTVAMTGDGVNDVLALKQADLGIAMGSGAAATRAVAQLVLLDNKFAVMPRVVAEGRRVLGNIERVADVFLTKTFYATIISAFIGLSVLLTLSSNGQPLEFPYLPRHFTLISSLTIGIPGFFLALMPNTERFRPGFLRRVLLFAVPAGVICAAAGLGTYLVVLSVGEPLADARSAATVALFVVAFAVLVHSARPLNLLRMAVCAAMLLSFVVVLVVPWLSNFFAVYLQPERDTAIALAFGFGGAVLVAVAARVTDGLRRA
ncbi:MAG: HAD-IC family P-type ATPase [Candidatus Nanopelagicales bacterium]|jgi:cation-transporting ATPase E